ncbi:MAG: hypothetical protein ACPG42_10585 [Alphaproteobacteria bacterium]|jgi:hypothetical protein
MSEQLARYAGRAWIGDAVLGGIGAGLLGLWTLVLLPGFWAVLPGMGLVGSLYLIGRALWLKTLTYTFDEDAGRLTRRAAFVAERRVDLSALTRADLHYLGTLLRGARGKSGLFVLHVADANASLRIESKVEGFHALTSAALRSFIEAGNSISLATYDNADAIEVDVGLKTEMISRPV